MPSINPRELVAARPRLAATGNNSVPLLGEVVTSSGFELPSPLSSIVSDQTPTTLPVATREVVSSSDGARLFATGPQSAASHPGEILEVDVATATVSRSVFVGADPKQLAISDGGSTLMVGHVSASKLTEVSVCSMSIDATGVSVTSSVRRLLGGFTTAVVAQGGAAIDATLAGSTLAISAASSLVFIPLA